MLCMQIRALNWLGIAAAAIGALSGCAGKNPLYGEHRAPQTPSVLRLQQLPEAPLLPFIIVQLNDRDALFLVDTGRPVTAVSSNLAKELAGPSDEVPLAATHTIPRLSIGYHEFSQLPVVLIPPSQLPSFADFRVDGVLGMNVLGQQRFGLDPGMLLFSLPHPGLRSKPVDCHYLHGTLWVDLQVEGLEAPISMKMATGRQHTTLGAVDFQRLAGDSQSQGASASVRQVKKNVSLGALTKSDFTIRRGGENLLGMDFLRGRILSMDPSDGHLWIGPEITLTDSTAVGVNPAAPTTSGQSE